MEVKKEPTCNLCGLGCGLGKPGHPAYEIGGLINAIVRGGYSSTAGNGDGALDDMTSYRFSMCEFCLDWLFTQFKVPVEVSDYTFSDDLRGKDGFDVDDVRPAWEPAVVRVAKDDWRSSKHEFCEEAERRAKARNENAHSQRR